MFDLTALVKRTFAEARGNPCIELAPIMDYAGRDVSHWFDERSGDLRYRRDTKSGHMKPLCPDGVFVGVPPFAPQSNYNSGVQMPWWSDMRNVIGLVTVKARSLYVKNTLTDEERLLEVCTEDRISDIAERYRALNSHIDSYTWKHLGRNLSMNDTLAGNGIEDEEDLFRDLGVLGDLAIPRLMIYFNDDLSEA